MITSQLAIDIYLQVSFQFMNFQKQKAMSQNVPVHFAHRQKRLAPA